MRRRLLVLTGIAIAAGASIFGDVVAVADDAGSGEHHAVMIIRAFDEQLLGIRAANPAVRLTMGHESALPNQRVLSVEFPAAAGPASRDVWSDAQIHDWTTARAIAFKARPDNSLRISVSFMDRNRVAHTAWADLEGGKWQAVDLPFARIKPNPYFQPPEANTRALLDLSDVKAIGFAPQTPEAGRLAITEFTVID